MITTTGIYHIGIPVNDVERAVKFYTEVLGMKIAKLNRDDMGDHLNRADLRSGDGMVVLGTLEVRGPGGFGETEVFWAFCFSGQLLTVAAGFDRREEALRRIAADCPTYIRDARGTKGLVVDLREYPG